MQHGALPVSNSRADAELVGEDIAGDELAELVDGVAFAKPKEISLDALVDDLGVRLICLAFLLGRGRRSLRSRNSIERVGCAAEHRADDVPQRGDVVQRPNQRADLLRE